MMKRKSISSLSSGFLVRYTMSQPEAIQTVINKILAPTLKITSK